jgi:integrase
MFTDTAYLKQRRQTWYFQIAVPRELQKPLGKIRGGTRGKPVLVLVESLKTTDKTEAQRLRWEKHREALELFDRLRGHKTLTLAEIEEAAEATFKSFLRDAQEAAEKGEPESDLEQQLTALLDAGLENDLRSIEGHANAVIAKSGADVPKGSRVYQELCQSQLHALIEATRGRMAFLEGKPYEPQRPFTTPVVDPLALTVQHPTVVRKRATTAGNGEKFVDAAARYVAAMVRDADAAWTKQTQHQNEATYRLFGDYLNGAPVASVTREDAAKFLDTLATLHPDYGRSPSSKGKSLSALVETFANKGETLTNRTLNRHTTALSALFNWAKQTGIYTGDNPFSGQLRKSGAAGWQPMNDDELKKLLASPLLAKSRRKDRVQPAKHTMTTTLAWLPLIALFSGMRSEEICQLRLADVMRDQGVWFFNVTEEDGQKVKSGAGVRKVPVHSALIKAGLLDYVKHVKDDPSGRLFPGLRPGGPDGKFNWYFTKAVGRYFTSLGITRKNVTFHSLRKNTVNAFERARVHQSEAALIVGHERGFTYAKYNPVGLELPALRAIVEKIRYPGVSLTHLYAL